MPSDSNSVKPLFPNLQMYKRRGDLKCPDCLLFMVPYRCGPVIIDKCYACNGIWFDHKEIGIFRSTLAQFDLSSLKIEFQKPENSPYCVSECPVCHEALHEIKYSYNSRSSSKDAKNAKVYGCHFMKS